jgi:hypothetical protein
VVRKFLGGRREGGLGGACHFDGPPEIGEALGEGEGLRIGAASAEAGVEVNGASGEIRRGHRGGEEKISVREGKKTSGRTWQEKWGRA